MSGERAASPRGRDVVSGSKDFLKQQHDWTAGVSRLEIVHERRDVAVVERDVPADDRHRIRDGGAGVGWPIDQGRSHAFAPAAEGDPVTRLDRREPRDAGGRPGPGVKRRERVSAAAGNKRKQGGGKAELTPAQARCEAKAITQNVFRWRTK